MHAVSAIGEFLARIKGDWTPENVTEAAGILRDLGLDVWQVRSFVGDGKGDKGGNTYRTIFLAQVTRAMTGETFLSSSLLDIANWRDFVQNALNQQVKYAEDRVEAVYSLHEGLGTRGRGITVNPFLTIFHAHRNTYSYLAAARAMTDSLNTPALKGLNLNAWRDGSFIGDRATTTQLNDEGRKIFDALSLQAMFYHPNGRLCIKVSTTHANFFAQFWQEKDNSSFEIYRGPDGRFYRVSDNSLVR